MGVVAIHNAVNERAWHEILRYEGLQGELSPKAQLLGFFGRSAPFDRHDWHVDRCGQRVRYVVDFYDGKPSASAPIAIHIDARPEVSVGGVFDRLRLWFRDLNVV